MPTTLAAVHPLSVLFYALAYGAGMLGFAWMARRRGLSTQGVWSVAVWGLLGGLAGATLAQWLVTFGPYTAAKTVLGGVAGGYLTVHLYKRIIGLKRPTGDLFAIGLCAGEAVGRWGCYFGGCCYGKAAANTDFWGLTFQHGALRYPTQIYLSLACILILAVLLLYERKRPPENSLFFLHGVLYSAARFGVEFFRDGKPPALGLTTAQWVCIGGILFFGVMWARLRRREAKGEALPTAHTAPASAQ